MDTVRIGLLGGTFNPIHNGHLHVARSASVAEKLDEVWFLPSGDPPHKAGRGLAPANDRLQMVRLAIEGIRDFRACDVEIERTGPTYTVDTLRQLTKLHPQSAFFYIIGMDTLLDLFSWKEIESVARLCTFLAVPRQGVPRTWAWAARTRIEKEYCGMVRFVPAPVIEVSSTELRRRIAAGETGLEDVPPKVETYIHKQGLYQENGI